MYIYTFSTRRVSFYSSSIRRWVLCARVYASVRVWHVDARRSRLLLLDRATSSDQCGPFPLVRSSPRPSLRQRDPNAFARSSSPRERERNTSSAIALRFLITDHRRLGRRENTPRSSLYLSLIPFCGQRDSVLRREWEKEREKARMREIEREEKEGSRMENGNTREIRGKWHAPSHERSELRDCK